MPQIQNIEPSLVTHVLILKPYGTYIIRNSTENDDILSEIKIQQKTQSSPYVILSVRVDENKNKYHHSVINCRLPLIQLNDENDLMDYYKQIQDSALPKLETEYIFDRKDMDWNIDKDLFSTKYISIYLSGHISTESFVKCNIPNRDHGINVFKKATKDNGQEFLILKTLSYSHIVTFYGIYEESDRSKYLVFADHGESLKIRYPEIEHTNEPLIKQLSMIGFQIACGMIYLEAKHIIHRDLHAGNILIDEQNFIRIADFEHAIIKEEDHGRSHESIQTPRSSFKERRSAPECLPSLPENEEAIYSYDTLFTEFSSKSDVWAYGLIFIELLIGPNDDVYSYVLPNNIQDDEETRQLVQYVKIDRQIHRKPDDCPENLYNVLKQCWIYSRDDRISFMNLRKEMLKLFQSTNK